MLSKKSHVHSTYQTADLRRILYIHNRSSRAAVMPLGESAKVGRRECDHRSTATPLQEKHRVPYVLQCKSVRSPKCKQ